MPVIQGWTVQDYLQSVQWHAREHWPDLVGVGSVCRRKIYGCHGVLEIVQALDRVLPPNTKLHLFGVKSEALSALAQEPRVASTDSMAWDFAARVRRRTSRTMDYRIECLERWVDRQRERLTAKGVATQSVLPCLFDMQATTTVEELVLEAIALKHAELILFKDMNYLDAVYSARRDAVAGLAIARQRGRARSDMVDLDEVISGLNELMEHLIQTRNVRLTA